MSTPNHFSDPDITAENSSPFTEIVTEANGSADEELVSKAQAGDKDALEKLVRRHQPWIFNIAIRMIWRRDLAEDATQEILIKAVTKLSTFRGLSRFRTWLYRIAVNHLLGMRKSQMEENMTFTGLGRLLDELPNLDLPDPNSIPVELPLSERSAVGKCDPLAQRARTQPKGHRRRTGLGWQQHDSGFSGHGAPRWPRMPGRVPGWSCSDRGL
jgi:DNA-directed RNA polymerase specialized sigma24 family protein